MRSTPLLQKLLVCLLAGLICGETFLRISDKLLTIVLPNPLILGISILIAICPLIYAIVWHIKREVDDRPILNFWIGAIRYGIAFDLTMFGLQKMFHLQLNVPLAMLDEPLSSFSNQWLTWSYFGRSYGFAVVIGSFQIIGSALLVFNRTRLFGSVFLMPMLLNIIVMDYFYELDLGVQIHAWILFAGLVYLIFLDYDRLLTFFFKNDSDYTSVRLKSNVAKYVGRLSIVALPLLIITIKPSPNKHPDLRGKYHVIEVSINGEKVSPRNEADSILTRVYFDIANECVFEFNGLNRRVFGTYESEDGENITTKWHFPETSKSNPFKGSVTKTQDGVALKGVMANDSIVAILKK
jgi:hypothetical protein